MYEKIAFQSKAATVNRICTM